MYIPNTKREREAIERNKSLKQLQRKLYIHTFIFVEIIFLCNNEKYVISILIYQYPKSLFQTNSKNNVNVNNI